MDGGDDRDGAERNLQRKVSKPNFINPAKEERWTLDDMLDMIESEYGRKGNRSFGGVKDAFRHLQAEGAFKFYRVVDVTTKEVQKYADNRLKTGAAKAKAFQ